MMHEWYYTQNGEQKGPVDEATLEKLYQTGEILSDDLIWEKSLPDWVKAGSVLKRASTIPSKLQSTINPYAPLPNDKPPEYTGNLGLPDYGDILCWGIAIIIVPCLGFLAFIGLMVLFILELVAVQRKIKSGEITHTSLYANIHPVLMGLGLFCCSIIFYPLFMHWRNESKLFKPQPHAVWFSIVIIVGTIIVSFLINSLSMMGPQLQELFNKAS